MKLPRARTLSCTLLLAAACRGDRRSAAAAHVVAADTTRPVEAVNIYAPAAAGLLSPRAAAARPLVYVPNSHDGTVTVIDPRTYRVLRTFKSGALPQHVVPSYDLSTLWVANNLGNTLTPIDPATGREGKAVAVSDPYNLYFTPDGRFAIVVAERRRRLDFRDARTMALVQSLPVQCKGVDHMEFTTDGRFAIATCGFCFSASVTASLSVRRRAGGAVWACAGGANAPPTIPSASRPTSTREQA